jgi:hypothetical protein
MPFSLIVVFLHFPQDKKFIKLPVLEINMQNPFIIINILSKKTK